MAKRLKASGFNIEIASDAYQGIEKSHRAKPDLIILDLLIPAGGGLTLLKNIRSIPGLSDIPVIVLTGMKNEEMKRQVMDQGVEAYLEKPYDGEKLVFLVKNILAGEEHTETK